MKRHVVHQGGAMINPNIASKVFQILHKCAKPTSIAADEDNVRFEHDEWRIIQEVLAIGVQ